MASSERFKDKPQAEALLAECRRASQAVLQKTEQKEKTEHPPALYDLTSLQRDANRLLGYSAQQTLDYTQALYEKKLVTYPRTDSRYLTGGMWSRGLPDLVRQTATHLGVAGENPHPCQNRSSTAKRSATTTQSCPPGAWRKLTFLLCLQERANVLRLIAARLLAAVGEPYRYAETTVQMECAGQVFHCQRQDCSGRGLESGGAGCPW